MITRIYRKEKRPYSHLLEAESESESFLPREALARLRAAGLGWRRARLLRARKPPTSPSMSSFSKKSSFISPDAPDIYIYSHSESSHKHTHPPTHPHTHTHLNAHLHTKKNRNTHTHTHTHTYTYTHIHTWRHTYKDMLTYMHIDIHPSIHPYIHAHNHPELTKTNASKRQKDTHTSFNSSSSIRTCIRLFGIGYGIWLIAQHSQKKKQHPITASNF